MSVSASPGGCLRHRCSSISLRIALLHMEFHLPLPHSSSAVSNAIPRLSPGISHLTYRTAFAPFTPNNSEQRLHPPYYRGCWHGVSRCFLLWYRQIPWIFTTGLFFPHDRALQPEGLHHPRGVAGSGLRPLHNLSPVTSSAQDDSISELLRFL